MKNSPKLRFPEFVNSGEWVEKEFSNYIKLYRGSSPRPIQEYLTQDNNGVNWIKIGDTKNAINFIIDKVEEKITPKGAEKSRKVEIGELILANSMSFGKTYELKIEGCIYDGWFVLREYEEHFCKSFLLQLLNSEYMQQQYKKLSAGGIVQNISGDIVNKTMIFHTSLAEQQKIADCLSSVDSLILAQSQKVELLKKHKKGLMQQLFPSEGESVPRLRFPEFVNDGEWEEKELGEIFQVTRGYVLSMNLVTDKQTEKQIYPVYSSQTKNKGLAGYYQEYLYENAITWTTDGANAGDVNYRKGKFYCTNVCGVLLNTKGYANICIAEIINSISKDYVSYVGNPKLMNGVMSKISIKIPSLPEQQKIADFLSSVDSLILAQSQKVELLKEHKKGLLQNLFPSEGENVPRLRFPEFANSGEWEEKELGNLFNFLRGSVFSKADIIENGLNKCIHYGELFIIYKERITEIKSYTNIENGQFSQKNDILMPSSDVTPEGLATASAIFEDGIIIGGDVNLLRPKKEVNSLFVSYFLNLSKKEIMKLVSGTTVKHIYNKDISKLSIKLPSFNEQQKIADCLSSIDELITSSTKKVELLKEHKKGLLQNLFPSGEVNK